jgi:hypothetical protein
MATQYGNSVCRVSVIHIDGGAIHSCKEMSAVAEPNFSTLLDSKLAIQLQPYTGSLTERYSNEPLGKEGYLKTAISAHQLAQLSPSNLPKKITDGIIPVCHCIRPGPFVHSQSMAVKRKWLANLWQAEGGGMHRGRFAATGYTHLEVIKQNSHQTQLVCKPNDGQKTVGVDGDTVCLILKLLD